MEIKEVEVNRKDDNSIEVVIKKEVITMEEERVTYSAEEMKDKYEEALNKRDYLEKELNYHDIVLSGFEKFFDEEKAKEESEEETLEE